MNIKRIIAREGLVILGWITLLILSVFNSAVIGNFGLWIFLSYPIYLVLRFVRWAILTLLPKEIPVDWKKIETLSDNHQYSELYLYMDGIEKSCPNILRNSAWIDIRETAIKGSIQENYYNPCIKLMGEKRWDEAIALSEAGLKIMNENLPFFMKGDESFEIFRKVMKEYENEKGELMGALAFYSREEIREELRKAEGLATMYFDFMMSPIIFKMTKEEEHKKAEKEAKIEDNPDNKSPSQ